MEIKWKHISEADDYTYPILGYIGHIWMWFDTVDHTRGYKFQIDNLETYIFNGVSREEAEPRANKIFIAFLENIEK